MDSVPGFVETLCKAFAVNQFLIGKAGGLGATKEATEGANEQRPADCVQVGVGVVGRDVPPEKRRVLADAPDVLIADDGKHRIHSHPDWPPSNSSVRVLPNGV